MITGKKIMALVLMAALLIPQNVYAFDDHSGDIAGNALLSFGVSDAEAEQTEENGAPNIKSAAAENDKSGISLSEEQANGDENAVKEELSTEEANSTSYDPEISNDDTAGPEEEKQSSSDGTAQEKAEDKSNETAVTDSSLTDSTVDDLSESDQKNETAEEIIGAGGPANDANLATGVYNICLKQNYKMFLCSKGNSEVHCANIEIVEKNYSKKQRWIITALGNGRYTIWNLSSGMALGVAGVTPKLNRNISQYRRNYANVKQFYIRKTGDGAVTIQPVGASYVLGAASPDVKPGVNIQLTTYTGQSEAKWRCVPSYTAPVSPGTYIIHTKLDDSKYITIDGATRKSGGNCMISSKCSAKQMTVYSAESDQYLIHPVCSNYTLTAFSTIQNGSDVKQYRVSNSTRQLWKFNDEGNGYYSIRLVRDDSMAMDISGGSSAEGTNVQIYKYNGSDAQLFSLEKTDGNRIIPNGYYALKSSADTKMAIEIANNSKSSAANVQLGTYNDRNKQKFIIAYSGNGLYYIRNARSGLSLDVTGASTANGTNVWQYVNNSSNAQKWKPVGSSSVFYFKSALGNVALDLNAGSTAPGTNVQIYTVNNTKAQKFKLVPVTTSEEKEFIVAIDAGHQRHQNTGREPIGPGSSTLKQKVSSGTEGRWSGLNEYELNLQVSLKLQAELEKRGYNVYMVRTTHDVNISNAERAQMAANAGADIFIRIHANGADSSSVRGALNYMPSSSNPYLSPSVISGSQKLARTILDSYCAATGIPNLGLLTGDDMTGINWAKMPVTIVEMGFMSNRTDDLYMASEAGQAQIVQGIANGVDRYFAS